MYIAKVHATFGFKKLRVIIAVDKDSLSEITARLYIGGGDDLSNTVLKRN